MVLQFHHRKFIKYAVTIATQEYCSQLCDTSDDSDPELCISPCMDSCPDKCKDFSYQFYTPPPPPSPHHPKKSREFLIISVTLIAAALLAIAIYAICVSRRRSRSQQRTINQTQDDFVDEDHGPVVDHHVWYIQTVGLQPSLISAITVCKYKKGDGLVEGTECSVCLNEFQDDETLRLLPKCNHAFHIPCIDTWLRSHTNCPMCRAPIVKNSARASSSAAAASASNTGNSSSRIESGDAGLDVLEENGEAETRLGDEVVEEEEMVEMQPMRRSVSLDSLSALKISQALANSSTLSAEESDSNTEIVSKRVSRNDSLARFVGTSSIRRSLSCSGKFWLSRGGCTRDSN